MSIWDNQELLADTANYVSFNKVGDKVAGVIKGIGSKRWDDGRLNPQLTLLCDDGEERVLTVGQIRLKKALIDLRPEEGQHITVVLTHLRPLAGGMTLKEFAVTVSQVAPAKAPKEAPADEPLPF